MGGIKWAWVVLTVAVLATFTSTHGKPSPAPVIQPQPPSAAPHTAPPNGSTPPSANGPTSAVAPGPYTAPLISLFPACEGVDVLYVNTFTKRIYPFLNDTPWVQPYEFQATATVTNMGFSEVKNWAMGIQYQHNEILVSAPGTVLADGQLMPANVTNGTILTGFPPENLKNAIETAGNLKLIQKVIYITGTEFGVKIDPMPLNINITNDGYNCSVPTFKGNNTMHSCCIESNKNISLNGDSVLLPPETGNVTITYDVTQAYQNNYMALVTISNDSPIQRIDHWNLSWTWQEGEFINSMMGAQTQESDIQVCLDGPAGITYMGGPDLNKVVSCSLKPEIYDLPVDRTNDTAIGGIKYCCKNGTIYPSVIDPQKSKSAFNMNVYKIPPGDIDLTHLVAPADFRFGIDGIYKCGIPRLLQPSIYPDPDNSLLHLTSAIKTWQVTCNITTEVKRPAKCCVSFSTYYNESIVPCPTCACGCPKVPEPVCDANSSALLLPYGALTLAPENRTNQIIAWTGLRHHPVPNPLPCQDYCGVSINWHIVSDYTKGWSARMTLLDWSNETYPDWFAVVEMDKAFLGLEQAYSFNATKLPPMNNTFVNNSFVVQGLPGLNYLVAEENFTSGKLQSVVSFTKDKTPGINIPLGDGFPTKIWFNGDECALPSYFPSAGAWQAVPSAFGAFVLALFVMMYGPFGLL